MLAANVGYIALAKRGDYFAQAPAVKEWASLIIAQRYNTVANMSANIIAHIALNQLVLLHSRIVNVNLPSNAAAVTASIGYALKILII
jgi:hypothetical protein